jgi:hypothetical protein
MCDHFIGFHAQRHLYQPKVLWRCSVCGRESRRPLDCCAHPDYASVPRTGVAHAVGHWLSTISAPVLTGWRAFLQRRRHPVDASLDIETTVHASNGQADDMPWVDTPTDAEAVAETTHVSA